MENHAKYGDSIYFRDGDALYVNLFVPSTVTWRERGLTLTQRTRFPDEDATRLTIDARAPDARDAPRAAAGVVRRHDRRR